MSDLSKEYFRASLPRVFAHRGLTAATSVSDGAPENTLLAFAAAVGVGATYLETDVHSSSDGVAVVSHDADLSRLAGLSRRVGEAGMVRDYTMSQLRRVDLGQSQSFTSLGEALDAFPETRFNIDIKSRDAVQPTVDAIRSAGATARVLVTSFSESRRRAAVRQLPGVATSAGASRFALALGAGKLRITPVVRRTLRSVDAVQVPMKYLGVSITTPRLIGLLHRAGVEVHVWTINDVSTMNVLLDLGVDGLVTDRVDLALDVVAKR